jgi:Uncharacterized membrane protein (homolog of Drosophila rhomboid)
MNEQYSPQGFRFLPPVCKNLLIINALVFVASLALRHIGIDLNNILGLHFVLAKDHHIWQWITYSFCHGNFDHIFFNMFALWMFGYTLENIWGGKKFLFFCFTAALGAALAQQITWFFMYKDLINGVYSGVATGEGTVATSVFLNMLVTIGASGIVFGVLVAFGMMFPNTYIYLYFLMPIKTKWFVIGYVVLELFSTIRSAVSVSDGIAHCAHLGGALAGVILILLWRKTKKY